MRVAPQDEATDMKPLTRRNLVLPAFLGVLCLMGLMALARGSSFAPNPNHPQQFADSIASKHVMHTPTLILREPLPMLNSNAPALTVTFVARFHQAEVWLSRPNAPSRSVRDRSPPPLFS